MAQYEDHERVRELLKRVDEITKESEVLRQRIEEVRNNSPEWPDRRPVSRTFDDRKHVPERS